MLTDLPPDLIAELCHAALVLDSAAQGLQLLVDGFQFARASDLLSKFDEITSGERIRWVL